MLISSCSSDFSKVFHFMDDEKWKCTNAAKNFKIFVDKYKQEVYKYKCILILSYL